MHFAQEGKTGSCVHNLLHCGIGSPKLFKPVRWDEPGSVVEEKLSGDQGEGERDDQGCEEEGLQETGDHRRPEKIEEKEDLGHQMTKMDLCSSVLLDLELGPDKSRDLRPLRSSARAALCSLQATNTSCSSARTILTCFPWKKTLEMKLCSTFFSMEKNS